MRIFETHAHLYMQEFDNDREVVIKECFENGIEYIINVSVDEESFYKSKELSEKFTGLFYTVGFHPHDAEKYNEEFLKNNIASSIAVGEIGLDYYRNLSPKKKQLYAFERQVEIAQNYKKPIIIHDRDAHSDCYGILKEQNAQNVVFHSYTGDLQFVKKVLNQGWFVAFNGIITFKNTHLTEVVKYVPTDRIFVETDSPYLSPEPKRGRRNTPLNLKYIIEKIAELKHFSKEIIAEKTFQNACNFFKILK